MSITVDTAELDRFVASLAAAPGVVQAETLTAMREITDEVRTGAQEVVPVWRGTLRDSLQTAVTPVEGKVFSDLTYARPVHDGRRPGAPMPPAGALVEWMADHGMDPAGEFALRRSISRRGIAAKPFLRTALEQVAPRIPDRFRQAWRRILDRLVT